MAIDDSDSEAIKADFMTIDNFRGEFDYLDPDYACDVDFKGLKFHSVMHAIRFLRYSHSFDGKKYNYMDSRELPTDMQRNVDTIGEAVTLEDADENPYWNENRQNWIELLLRDKYRRNESLRKKLAETGERGILYRSGDHFLGYDRNKGRNMVGRITEEIRKDVVEYKDHLVWLFMCQNMSKEDFDITLDETKDSQSIERHVFKGKCCYDIGRIPSCHLRPANPSISRVHASLCMKKNGTVCVVSYNSVTGITVGGKYVKANHPVPLKNGDQLTIGASKRVYLIVIENDMVRRKLQSVTAKRLELKQKAEQKAKEVHTELDTYLKGSDEIVVLNLSYKTKRPDIYDFFMTCGEIEYVQLPQERGASDDLTSDNTAASRGIAFVKFKDKRSAANALERDGMYLNYRKVRVKYKTKQTWKEQQRTFRRRSRSRSRSRSSSSSESNRHWRPSYSSNRRSHHDRRGRNSVSSRSSSASSH